MPRRGHRGGGRAPQRNVPHLRSSRGAESRPAPGLGNGPGPTGFTLQDEARSTAHRSSPWSSDSKLRHRPVAFVTTGSTEPLKQLEDLLQHEQSNHPKDGKPPDGHQISEAPNPTDAQINAVPLDEPGFTPVEPRLQDPSLEQGADEPIMSPPDHMPMDTTLHERQDSQPTTAVDIQPVEETPAPLPFFIDVTGDRSSHLDKPSIRMATRSPSPAPSDSSEEVILFKGRNNAAKDKGKPFNLGGMHTEIKVVEETVLSCQDDHVSFGQESRRRMRAQKRQDDDDLIADYIANMREHGDDEGLIPADAYSRRDLGGSLSESESIEGPLQTSAILDDQNITRGERGDADGVTEGPEAAVGVRKMKNKKGKSKKGKGLRVDDALLAVLETDDASYLASLEQSHAEDAFSLSGSSTDQDIFNEEDEDEEEEAIFNAAADRFANEIDDFDYMDWERPALKRKKGKGAKGKVPIFDISDSELEGKMQAAWKNDRLKKAERKKERQALRVQGLLGKHANPEDLRVKYPDGMGLEQIADELKTFLLSTHQILTLPPMDNHARKVIHELASKFNIKSKSTGSGNQRRPMLHRTFKTAKFAEEVFDAAIARVGRKYFPRNDTALRAAVQRQSVRRGGGGGGNMAVQYRDGEVVGGSAPELSQENRGRAMLEKMGWSSGTALGALNNKGILQPVAHVVKRSKAGLG